MIELIIVVAVIALLAAAVFVAVDPAKRIGEANNAQRWSDITAVTDAIMKYTVDNNGTLPFSGMTNNKVYMMTVKGAATTGSGVCTNASTTAKKDMSSGIVDTYFPTIPLDPSAASGSSTSDYFIIYNSSSGRIRVGACTTYSSASISVQR